MIRKTKASKAPPSVVQLPPEIPFSDDFPIAFDPEYYRAVHEDLERLSDPELRDHFWNFGLAEGRPGAALAFREPFLQLISGSRDTLEIGPSCIPLVRGNGVRYFDIAARETLIETAKQLGVSFSDPPVIDYVSPTGDAGIIDRQFDQVFSSHCIEHQPDLVRHLNDVARILRTGGIYFLIIPDKRFCFDHYMPESTIADILAAHVDGRKIHQTRSILENMVMKTHNDPNRHWAGDHGSQEELMGTVRTPLSMALEYVMNMKGKYVDAHAWYFTPASFQDTVRKLAELRLTKLRLRNIYNTPARQFEFCAIFEKVY